MQFTLSSYQAPSEHSFLPLTTVFRNHYKVLFLRWVETLLKFTVWKYLKTVYFCMLFLLYLSFVICFLGFVFFFLPQCQRLSHPLSSFFPNHPANPEYSIFSLLSFFEAEPVAGKLRKGRPVGVFH